MGQRGGHVRYGLCGSSSGFFARQADWRISAGGILCAQRGRGFKAAADAFGAFVECARGMYYGVCGACFLCGNCGAAFGKAAFRDSEAAFDDTCVLSWRQRLLPALRPFRAYGVCTDGNEHQHRNGGVWRTGCHYHSFEKAKGIKQWRIIM